MAFSFSGFPVAQGQTGFCHPVVGVSGLPALRGRTCPLNGTVLVLISTNADPRPMSGRSPGEGNSRTDPDYWMEGQFTRAINIRVRPLSKTILPGGHGGFELSLQLHVFKSLAKLWRCPEPP